MVTPKRKPSAKPSPAEVAAAEAARPKCEKVEQFLRSNGVAFEPLITIGVADIDSTSSLSNQARSEPLDPEFVDKYCLDLRNGFKMPPLVVYRRGTKFVIIDGNQRLAAYEKVGIETFDVYVVAEGTSSADIELLTAAANAHHPKATSAEWRAHQAVHLLAQGIPEERVVKALAIPKTAIRTAMRVAKGYAHAESLGINRSWDRLSYQSKSRVSTIVLDLPFLHLVRLIADFDFKGKDLQTFITTVRKATSETDAAELVKEKRKELEFDRKTTKRKGGRPIHSPKTEVMKALGMVINQIDSTKLLKYFLTDDERVTIAKRMSDAAVILMECEEVLRKALKDVE